MFNRTAGDYDLVERLMAMGSGSWYRRRALIQAGLSAGMRVLDVGMGTGLLARQEIEITGDPRLVLGIDPSIGMIAEARKSIPIQGLLGMAEELPLADEQFDFVSMGYALRHVSDLDTPFAQFLRVLRPDGTLCILEITRPKSRLARAVIGAYMRRIVPAVTRLATRHADSQRLWEYYWDTIDGCVPSQIVIAALRSAGFENIRHQLDLGIFSAYTARKPSPAPAAAPSG